MCGFQRNLDMARNGRLGGWECIWLIAIDYHTVTGTAEQNARETEDQRGPDGRSPEWTPMALWKYKSKET